MVLANDKQQQQELQQIETNNKINLTYTKKKYETTICICTFAYSTHQDQQTGKL